MSMDNQARNQQLLKLMLAGAEPRFWDDTRRLTRESLDVAFEAARASKVETVYIVGQGTSLATAMNAETYFAKISRLDARALTAFEFSRYIGDYLIHPERSMVVGISCGGNTKSVRMSLEAARAMGALTVCIAGEGDIGCAALADWRVVTDCQIERRDDARHPYSVSHLMLLMGAYELALRMGRANGALDASGEARWRDWLNQTLSALNCLPALYGRVGAILGAIQEVDTHIALGSGPNRGTAQEGALKVGEFCWRLGAAEELEDFAHGRFRELGANTALLIIAPDGPCVAKAMDVLAGTYVSKTPTVVLTDAPTPAMRKLAGHIVEMPRLPSEYMTPFVYVFPFWFYGYRANADRGELVGGARYGLYAVDIDFEAHFDAAGNRLGAGEA